MLALELAQALRVGAQLANGRARGEEALYGVDVGLRLCEEEFGRVGWGGDCWRVGRRRTAVV